MEEKIPINQTIPETDVHQAVTDGEISSYAQFMPHV
jgi:hypothetical protein